MFNATLFVSGCPNFADAAIMIHSNVSGVVTDREPVNSDELCARSLLIDHGVDYRTNHDNDIA